jgi:hypothetical protein
MIFLRSCYPFLTLVVILGTVLWGPFVSLVLALSLWQVNRWIG